MLRYFEVLFWKFNCYETVLRRRHICVIDVAMQ